MATETDLAEELVVANRILVREGVLDAFGHVSVRKADQPDHFLISRSLAPELVTRDDIQILSLDLDAASGDTRRSYLEVPIHAELYRARPDVIAVCHNHSPSVIPLGVTGVPLRPVFHMGSLIGADVPMWDIREGFGDTDMLVRTAAQGRSLAAGLGGATVALMRGHGAVVTGARLRDVVFTAVYMERNARLQLEALRLGDVRYLTREETERARATLLEPNSSDRVWDYFRTKATR